MLKTIEELCSLDGVESLVVARELTKVHEEIIKGSPKDIFANLKARSSIKGEFAIVVIPGVSDDNNQEDSYIEA